MGCSGRFCYCSVFGHRDAGAYFVGRAIGKNKLWPAISPNKTVEGALGGIVIAIVTAIIFAICIRMLIELWKSAVIGICHVLSLDNSVI